jgi:hypothetical protein
MEDKISQLKQVSDINRVKKRAKEVYGLDVLPSTKKDKKFMIKNGEKVIHFGSILYQDYTKSHDKKKRDNYLKRATMIKGDWKDDPLSPNWLAIILLWAYP